MLWKTTDTYVKPQSKKKNLNNKWVNKLMTSISLERVQKHISKDLDSSKPHGQPYPQMKEM